MRRIVPGRNVITIAAAALVVLFALLSAEGQEAAAQPAQPSGSKVRTVGTIKSISANNITLTTDAGSEVTVVIQPSTKLLRMAPGQTDLKQAAPIQLQDLQVGDRLLGRRRAAPTAASRLRPLLRLS